MSKKDRHIQFHEENRKIELRFVEKIVIFNFTRKIGKSSYSIHEKNRKIEICRENRHI